MEPMDIVRQVPVWVPFLFVFLLVLGLRARHRREMPVVVMNLIPCLSLLSIASLAALSVPMTVWAVCGFMIAVGAVLGARLQLGYILARHGLLIELAGENVTLALLMGIFLCNFILRLLTQIAPAALHGGAMVAAFAAVIGLVTGMFVGRAWAVFRTPA